MKAQTKALIASVVVIALALSAVSGITYSWWSDTESTDITVTTGYVDVETDNFKITKGTDVVYSGTSEAIPDSIGITYSDTASKTEWYSDSNSLVVTGNPGETITISYTATFTWTVAAKFMMGFGSTSEELKNTTGMTISTNGTLETTPNNWVQPSESDSSAEYSVTVTINGLPSGVTDAELQISNYITQAKNPISIWDGSSTPVTPTTEGSTTVYEVNTASELAWVAEKTNSAQNFFTGKTIRLVNDIDLNGLVWTPIGIASGGAQFTGTFDGQNHTIYGLNVPVTDTRNPAGLFGWLGNPQSNQIATVTDLIIDGASVEGHHYVGGIAGYLEFGSITGCVVKNSKITATPLMDNGTGKMDDGDKVGGIVGYINSYAQCSVTGCEVEDLALSGVSYIGCITGVLQSQATFKDNAVLGANTITVDQTEVTGDDLYTDGIVGWNNSGATLDSSNEVTGSVTISAMVCTSNQFNKVLQNGILDVSVAENTTDANGYCFAGQNSIPKGNIVITLLDDVTFVADSGTQTTNAFDGSSTGTVTFDGQNQYTLTFYHPDSDANHVATNGAKLVLKDLKLSNTGYNNGPWNRHDIVFDCEVELSNVQSDKAIALGGDATFDNVTIAESDDGVYALWIKASVSTVSLKGLVIENHDSSGAYSDGRAIAIKDEYVSAVERVKVSLTITDSDIESQKKAAVLVTSTVGATITASNVDISGVAADSTNLVWVDSDSGYHNIDDVAVSGCTVIVEP